MKDWYLVLGVSKQASETEIKASYRRLAKQYHPDMHPGDSECERRFRDISEAYSILSDPEKRRKYDGELQNKRDEKYRKNTDEKRTETQTGQVDFGSLYRNFESFFGFHPDTKEIVNEKKLNPDKDTGNPLDTTAVFEKFMGITEYQNRLKGLEAQKTEAENLQIVQVVRSMRLTPQELTAMLSGGGIPGIAAAPADYDGQEEKENEE